MTDLVSTLVEAWISKHQADLREKMGGGQLLHTMGEGRDRYVYSSGFTNSLGYELIVVGMPTEHATPLIAAVGRKLMQQSVDDGEAIADVASSPVRLRTQSIRDETGTFSMAPGLPMVFGLGFTPTHVRQIIWPDAAGKYPEDPGFAAPYRLATDILRNTLAGALN